MPTGKPSTHPVLEGLDYGALSSRKDAIQRRLEKITVRPLQKASVAAPPKRAATDAATKRVLIAKERTDTHHDFLLKEMQWLAADFAAERKRHRAASRKLANSVAQHRRSAELRAARKLAEAAQRRKKLAARIGREVRGWWTKMDRVVTYKQKITAETERRKAMNRQLVKLVKQTERYSESLASRHDYEEVGGGERHMSIEEALLEGETLATRRSKRGFKDYARMATDESSFYGESTDDEEAGSDESYDPRRDDDGVGVDDETTLQQAEAEETLERRRQAGLSDDEGMDAGFLADPEELQKLQEEAEMDVEVVLERLREGAEEGNAEDEAEVELRSSKRVKFSAEVQVHPTRETPPARESRSDPGGEADDDADMSDVEDFVETEPGDDDDDDDEEFEAVEEDLIDDETTMEQEERLPREMSASAEIRLLKDESEVPVEELRRRYAAVFSAPPQPDEDESEEEVEEQEGGEEEAPADTTFASATAPSQLAALFSAAEGEEDEEDYRPTAGTDVDDETTIEAEERLGRDMSYEDEIAMLKRESEMSVEELQSMYQSMSHPDEGQNDSLVDETEDMEEEDAKPSVAEMIEAGENDDQEADEYRPQAGEAVDDETTIEAEEKLGRDMSYEDEIALLKRESKMSMEELRARYSQNSETGNEPGQASELASLLETAEDEENDTDFTPDAHVQDDETTIEAEERLGREMSPDAEIALLQQESEIPVEALRERYQRTEDKPDDEHMSESDQETARKRPAESLESEESKRRRQDESEEEASDAGAAALSKLNRSAELARRTRATRPFLLTPWVKLREYQQIGLNWLVSLQTRRLNGILADEMGLGKTLQTISLFAYLAAYKGIWGPHLVIVPTSVILNWETELKRFCPALKVLCYFGTAKRRKELRTGWTKSNLYHVVITSYQLAVQDAFAFKRKRWYYLVLDEAQNIKNFQSQRWQTLINFNSQRRLLLTGTPLQNNLMELWSLLHFLMPHIFRSRKEFSYWFANPMNSMVQGTSNRNDDIVNRLHGIIRPFVLRRLKKDVETQMPGKYEHVVQCQLSRRQMFIYEEFMARSSTRQALRKGGNFLGMMNVLMQLRKVCNHPDLFEPRSVITPFVVDSVAIPMPSCVFGVAEAASMFSRVSGFLLAPLWSGSQGEPSADAALRHERIESEELLALEASIAAPSAQVQAEDTELKKNVPPLLLKLAAEIREGMRAEKVAVAEFCGKVNSWRCRASSFVCPRRLIDAVAVSTDVFDRKDAVLSTPTQLLSMRRDQYQRAEDFDELIKKFVFCVPKAGARPPTIVHTATRTGYVEESTLNEMLLEPLEECLRPFREAHARLSSSFPDKKLVQFDAGKLQTLADLLRERKRGGHKVLVFTQMSKMLDILEVFLNLNGHTYLRLDGSTGVERRQRLMDKFNNDPKIFCFILSTRSGGLGINLTGADTVVFYDSDWNPAMDAQAQDRAHRIGQTREVHIFRLITEHTIEENILKKAQQKRNLDTIVMDRGKFDASQLGGKIKEEAEPSQGKDVYTKGGLREILGVTGEAAEAGGEAEDEKGKESALSREQMEKTMTSLEDADDVNALRGAQKEAADELKEFDESVEYKKESDAEEGAEAEAEAERRSESTAEKDSRSEKTELPGEEEKEMEEEFAAWQDKVGMDASAIESSLSPMERYGLHFKEEVDPFYSIFAVMEYKRKMEEQEEQEEEVDIDEIEHQQAIEERRAMDEGDLLATNPKPEDLIRQRNMYRREKARLRGNKKRRKLTGENWEVRADAYTKHPFWYNIDTGEALWDKPQVLLEMEAFELANKKKWAAMPVETLVRVIDFLSPYPDRMLSALVCRQWHRAVNDISFVRHVYPVELGAYTRDERKMEHNHYRTIADAVAAALPGDTVELGDGHYWLNDDLVVDVPLRIIGDENNPSNVVVEMSGTIVWRANGFCEGVTFRRPKISSGEPSTKEMLRVEANGKIDVIYSVLDNEGSLGNVVSAGGQRTIGRWENVVVQGGRGGVSLTDGARMELKKCSVKKNSSFGVSCRNGAEIVLVDCTVDKNEGPGIVLRGRASAIVRQSQFLRNKGGISDKEPGCTTSFSGNSCTKQAGPEPPGFRLVEADSI